MFRKAIVLAVVLIFSVSEARSDEVSKRAKVEELITLIRPDSLMQQTIDRAVAQAERSAKDVRGDRPMTEIDRKILDKYGTDIRALIAEALSWPRLRTAYVDSYAAAYTEEEIDGILAFYKSSTGQAMLAKSPEILAKLSEVEGENLKEVGPRLHNLTSKMESQLAVAHTTNGAHN